MKTPSPHPLRPRRPRAAGFSLIEVLMAIGILAIGVLTVASLFPVAIAQQKAAADDILGTNYGLTVLEVLKAQGKLNANPLAGPYAYSASSNSYHVVNISLSDNTPQTRTLPKVVDANNLFNYSLAYRRVSSTGPVELAIFVYRKSSLDDFTYPATPTPDYMFGRVNLSEYKAGTGYTIVVPPNGTTVADSTGFPSDKNVVFANQLMLVQDTVGSGVNDAFIVRVSNVTPTGVQFAVNPPDNYPNHFTYNSVIACGAGTTPGNNHSFKTVAIVTGVIP